MTEPASERPPFVGRARELGALAGAARELRTGVGRTVLLEGAAGVGKSRLLAEATAVAAEQGVRVLGAAGHEAEEGFASGVVRALLRPLADGGEDPSGRRSAGPAALAAAFLRGEQPEAAEDTLDFALLHGLVELVSDAADDGPLLVAVDDLHWVDEPSLRVLAFLARRAREIPFLLVLASRPDARAAAAELRDATAVEAVAPLRAAAAAELVRAVLGDAATDAVCAACHDASGGNAFLLTTLVRHLAASGVPAATEAIGALAVGDVARFTDRRLRALGPAAAQAARALAVLGPAADAAAAARLVDVPARDAARTLDALVAADIVAVRDGWFAFAHPLLRTAVLEATPAGALALLHAEAAKLLIARGADPQVVAGHLLHAPAAGRPEHAAILRAAAAAATAWGQATVADALLRRALAEPPAPAALVATLTDLAAVQVRLGGPAAAVAFDTALAAAGDPAERAAVDIARGRLLLHYGAPDAAVAAFDAARAVLPADAPELRVDLEVATAELLISPEHAGAAIGHLLAFTEDLTPVEDREFGLAAMRAYYEIAMGDVPAAMRLASAVVARPELVLTLPSVAIDAVGVPHIVAEDFAPYEAWLRAGRSVAESRGSGSAYRITTGSLGFFAMMRGDIGEAESLVREVKPMFPPGSYHHTIALALLVHILAVQGRWDESAAMFATWVRPETPYPILLLPALAHGAALIARGDVEDGVARIEAEFERLSWQEVLPVHRDLALGLAALGRREEALALAEERVERARRGPEGPAKLGPALRILACVRDDAGAVPLLDEAVRTLAPTYARLEHARALVDLGAALRRAGRRADARPPLREGLELAQDCGARPLAERAAGELAATGERVRRGRLLDRDALTPSEDRVARLAATGRTNRQIADALGVGRKTVEVHLTSTYRKLGIDSRSELAAALASGAGSASLP